MPLPIPFEWSEDEHMLYFVLKIRSAKAKDLDILFCDVYIKANHHPSLFEADLSGEIDPDHPKTRCRISADKVTLNLRKKKPGLWHDFRAHGSKDELRERRRLALSSAEEREKERQKQKEEWKQDMLKAGEHEQWRLDRENREQIEKWQAQEKEQWEHDVYAAFDEETKTAVAPIQLSPASKEDFEEPVMMQKHEQEAPSSSEQGIAAACNFQSDNADQLGNRVQEVSDEEAQQIQAEKVSRASLETQPSSQIKNISHDPGVIWTDKDLEDTEEYVPEVRENPGKVGIRFSERPKPGVPVRDRGTRAPPYPRKTVKSDAPPMIAGEELEDESDPVWLKDKADNLMVNGDYQGAFNAYTEALKLASNARAFANRSVADLYLGNFEQCIEDGNHAIRILELRRQAPDGGIPTPADPEDELVRARVEVRIATSYLWLGAFKKAEEHLTKALDVESGLAIDERKKVKDDLQRVQSARAALNDKEKGDAAARFSHGSAEAELDSLATSLDHYTKAAELDSESAVIFANRCFVKLQAGQLHNCIKDADTALHCLRQWPAARRAPKPPARPSRLDPPYLDDPTFKHPNEVKQGDVDWLMKHNGGTRHDLPDLPPEYEWVKDAAERDENAWIAVRKKMTKATIDAVRRATVQLQDALYARNPQVILEQLKLASDLNKAGEGPSNKALYQANEYVKKLQDHLEEKASERETVELELKQEMEECDLEELLAPVRSGVAQTGFGRNHPVEKTRRRLFVKVLLRKARALELLGEVETSAAELQSVLRVEPDNLEAKQRLATLIGSRQAPEQSCASNPGTSQDPMASSDSAASTSGLHITSPPVTTCDRLHSAMTKQAATHHGTLMAGQQKKNDLSNGCTDTDKSDSCSNPQENEVDDVRDHSSTAVLLESAAKYMRNNDYSNALQIYNYARRTCKSWESPMVELKVLSNTSLCLHRLRGRLPELVEACNEAVKRIHELHEEDSADISTDMLVKME